MNDHSAAWANGALVGDSVEALRNIENVFTVGLIATPREAFRTCQAAEQLARVVERYRSELFDFLPVIEASDDQIIGLIELVAFMGQPVGEGDLVSRHMQPLSEKNLIGNDAGILDFIRHADHHRCRLVIEGRRIAGLVTLSDLQRLPVRAVLFTMVTHLEILMAEFIRRDCPKWLKRLPTEQQRKIRRQVEKSRQEDSFVDELLLTNFSDKATIIQQGGSPLVSTGEFAHDLERVRGLRNALAHADHYAASRRDAIETCETVRIIDRWIELFARYSDAATPSLPHSESPGL